MVDFNTTFPTTAVGDGFKSSTNNPSRPVTHLFVEYKRITTDENAPLTYGSVVNMQRLGRHELTHQRRLANARGSQHCYAKRLGNARTTGATGLSGRGQRCAGTGSRRSGVGAAAATSTATAYADYRVVGSRQVFGAETSVTIIMFSIRGLRGRRN